MTTFGYIIPATPAADSDINPYIMRSLPSSMNELLVNFRRLIFSELSNVARAFVRNRDRKMKKEDIILAFFRGSEGTDDYDFWKQVGLLNNKIINDPRDVTPNDFLGFGETLTKTTLEYADGSRRLILKAYFNILELLLRKYPLNVPFNNMKNMAFEAILTASPLLNTEEGNEE